MKNVIIFSVLLTLALCMPAQANPQNESDRSEVILSAMLKLPVFYLDRDDTPEQRRKLYLPIARAINFVAKGDRHLEAALIAQGHSESVFARPVIEGRCEDMPVGMRCDWSRRLKRPMSRGAWQVKPWCSEAWSKPDGSRESIFGGAICAARLLKMGKARCGTWIGAFAAGHGSGVCERPLSAGREAKRKVILQYL